VNRVAWFNGQTVRAEHFQAQEEWIESLHALGWRLMDRFGIYSSPAGTLMRVKETNDIHKVEIDVPSLSAITPRGRALIFKERALSLSVDTLREGDDGVVYLRSDSARPSAAGDLIQEEDLALEPTCEVTLEWTEDCVPIGRLEWTQGGWIADEDFLAPGLLIGSGPAAGPGLRLIKSISNLAQQVRLKLASTKGRDWTSEEIRRGAELALLVLGTLEGGLASASDPTLAPHAFLCRVESALGSIDAALEAFGHPRGGAAPREQPWSLARRRLEEAKRRGLATSFAGVEALFEDVHRHLSTVLDLAFRRDRQLEIDSANVFIRPPDHGEVWSLVRIPLVEPLGVQLGDMEGRHGVRVRIQLPALAKENQDALPHHQEYPTYHIPRLPDERGRPETILLRSGGLDARNQPLAQLDFFPTPELRASRQIALYVRGEVDPERTEAVLGFSLESRTPQPVGT